MQGIQQKKVLRQWQRKLEDFASWREVFTDQVIASAEIALAALPVFSNASFSFGSAHH